MSQPLTAGRTLVNTFLVVCLQVYAKVLIVILDDFIKDSLVYNYEEYQAATFHAIICDPSDI